MNYLVQSSIQNYMTHSNWREHFQLNSNYFISIFNSTFPPFNPCNYLKLLTDCCQKVVTGSYGKLGLKRYFFTLLMANWILKDYLTSDFTAYAKFGCLEYL